MWKFRFAITPYYLKSMLVHVCRRRTIHPDFSDDVYKWAKKNNVIYQIYSAFSSIKYWLGLNEYCKPTFIHKCFISRLSEINWFLATNQVLRCYCSHRTRTRLRRRSANTGCLRYFIVFFHKSLKYKTLF